MILKAGFHFSVSFLSPFFLFHEDDQSSSPAPNVFPIYLFVYLFMYFYSPATPPSSSPRPRHPRRRCHRLPLEKTFCLGRNCLPGSRYIGYEAPSFFPGVLHRHSQFNTSKVIDTFEAHPTSATPARNR